MANRQIDPREEAGRAAYEEDVRRCPNYSFGAARPSWDQLGEFYKDSWRRNPTPRNYSGQVAA